MIQLIHLRLVAQWVSAGLSPVSISTNNVVRWIDMMGEKRNDLAQLLWPGYTDETWPQPN